MVVEAVLTLVLLVAQVALVVEELVAIMDHQAELLQPQQLPTLVAVVVEELTLQQRAATAVQV